MQIAAPLTPFVPLIYLFKLSKTRRFHKIHLILLFFLLILITFLLKKNCLYNNMGKEKEYSKRLQLMTWFRLQTPS